MNTKSGCGRLDLSAVRDGLARPAWPVVLDETAPAETKTWRPAELDRPDLASLFQPRRS